MPFFSCYFACATAKAECHYSNYALALKVTMITGQELTCYRTISACYLNVDSIHSSPYLKALLFNTDGATDSTWCRYRATYRYCAEGLIDCAKTDQAILYHLFDPFHLDSAATSNISVEAYERVSALEWLSSDLQVSDTVLFHQRPTQVIACAGYLCFHQIAAYRHSSELDVLLPEIVQLNAEIAELEDGEEDAYDERMLLLMDRLRKADGLIVLSGCSD
ncbi:MAG: hypothetical protein IPI00_18010 [Flavobacteriales bacterium]|nr:hypothetical protein [Flavobacteriales bacterium]